MADAPLGQDDIDKMLSELGVGEAKPAAAPAPTPAPQSGGSLGQDDIDKMLAELGAGDAQPAAAPAPTPPPAAQSGGTLGQDDIDKMLAELGAGDAQPAAAPAAKPPTKRVQAAAPAADDGALNQDAIDALIARAAEVVAEEPKTASVTSGAGGHLDQTEIDKLLADLDPQSRKSSATGSASAHLDQKDIDRLLNELDVTTGSSRETVPAAGKLPASGVNTATLPVKEPVAAPAPTASTSTPNAGAAEGPLSQDDIDKMLSELGNPTQPVDEVKQAPESAIESPPRTTRKVPPAPQPVVAGVVPKPADATLALTPEEIDAIVAKQGNSAPPGSESEAVIAQADIDALVKQLAQATGSPEAQEVADAIAGKAADIDRIQAEAGEPVGPDLTRDAVDVNSILGRTASTANNLVHPGSVGTVATVATIEWQAARWLLVAAVLLLGICSGALIVLTMSVSGLSGELRAAREVEHPPVDGYADKLRLALAKLGESDESERARGVRLMDELKREHPERAADVGIALARHFRGRDAWRRAADEYGAALESVGGADDPRVALEHADCLTRLGDAAGAIRQIYILLAAEARWTAERDSEGRAMPGLDRNRQAIADAYLMLGRLLARDGATATLASASSPAEPATAAGGHH